MSYLNRLVSEQADVNPFLTERSLDSVVTASSLSNVRSQGLTQLPGLSRSMLVLHNRNRENVWPSHLPRSTSRDTLYDNLLRQVKSKITAQGGMLGNINLRTAKAQQNDERDSTVTGDFSTFPCNGVVKTYHFVYDTRQQTFRKVRVETGEAH